MSEASEQEPLRVRDRRRFSPDGKPLEEPAEAASPQEEAASETAPPEPPKTDQPPAQQRQEQQPFTPPPAKFEMLVLSLAMQAEMELAGGAAKESGPPNLDLARHTIDLLAILQEKTTGNLTFEEQRLLDNTVTELRFRYVQKVGEVNKAVKG